MESEEYSDEETGQEEEIDLSLFSRLERDISSSRFDDIKFPEKEKDRRGKMKERMQREDMPQDNKYTLWRNLKEYLKDSDLDQWTKQLASPIEVKCLIKQTTECTDPVRLDNLMDLISGGSDPDQIKLYEVLELIHNKTSKFHSQIGMNYAQITNILSEKEGATESAKRNIDVRVENKRKDIENLSKDYVTTINTITNWVFGRLDELLPYDSLPENVKKEIENRYGSDKDQLKKFQLSLRSYSVKRKILSLIDIHLEDIEKGYENLANAITVSYVQQQGIKAKKNWGHRRYTAEGFSMYSVMYSMVKISDYLSILRNRFGFNVDGIGRKMYVEQQRKIADTFEKYYRLSPGILSFLVITKLIPSPIAQSTYLIKSSNIELCNLLMWPDRIAQTANLHTKKYLEIVDEGVKLKKHIIDDYLDLWYWKKHREKFIPIQEDENDFLVSKPEFLVSLAFENVSGENWMPEDEWLESDMEFLRGCCRDALNQDFASNELNSLIEARNRDPHKIYTQQYLNRLSRGLNVYNDPDDGEPYVFGEFINGGYACRNVIIRDIMNLSDETFSNFEVSPSEFHLYTESLENEFDLDTGSFISYKMDNSPILGKNNIGYAGHTYTFKLTFANQEESPHIWFKDTLRLHKRQESKKPKKVLSTFFGWLGKTIQLDTVCENTKENQWYSFPDWMLLIFKLMASIIYCEETNYQKYLFMIPLDRLKRFGKVPEHLLVYFLRKYLGFGLCINEAIDESNGREGFYIGRDDTRYDYDYVIQDMKKIYTQVDDDQVLHHTMQKIDVTEPYLIRPLPTCEELWKMWQFYIQSLNTFEFKTPMIDNLEKFLSGDKKLNTGRMRYVNSPGLGKIFRKNLMQEMEAAKFDPLDYDDEPIE